MMVAMQRDDAAHLLPLPLAGEGWGEGARQSAYRDGNGLFPTFLRPHPPCGHLLPQAGEG